MWQCSNAYEQCEIGGNSGAAHQLGRMGRKGEMPLQRKAKCHFKGGSDEQNTPQWGDCFGACWRCAASRCPRRTQMRFTMKAILAGAGARSALAITSSAVMPAVSGPSIATGSTASMAPLLTPITAGQPTTRPTTTHTATAHH